MAVRGAGAFADGERLHVRRTGDVANLRGAALTRFLDGQQRAAIDQLGRTIGCLGPGRPGVRGRRLPTHRGGRAGLRVLLEHAPMG